MPHNFRTNLGNFDHSGVCNTLLERWLVKTELWRKTTTNVKNNLAKMDGEESKWIMIKIETDIREYRLTKYSS